MAFLHLLYLAPLVFGSFACKSTGFSDSNRRKCNEGQVETTNGCSAPAQTGPLPEGDPVNLGPAVGPITGGDLDPRTLSPEDYECRQNLKYLSPRTSSFGQGNGGSQRYQDIMEHAPFYQGQPYRHFAYFKETGLDMVISAHETIHFYGGLYGQRSSGNPRFGYRFIYFGNGRGAPLARSIATKSQTIPLVSSFVRSLTSVRKSVNSPFNVANITFLTYLERQSASSYWEQRLVGHLFEEYACYNNDGRVAVELAEAGFGGHIESVNFIALMYHTTAGTKAVADYDPSYFSRNAAVTDSSDYHQMKAIYACMVEESMELYRRAKLQARINMKASDLILSDLRTGSGSSHLRNHLRSWIGPVWTKRVLGF